MRLTIAALALSGCTATNFQMQPADLADLAELPDVAAIDQAAAPDLVSGSDLAGADFAGADLARGDMARSVDMVPPPDMLPSCGLEGQPCCAVPPALQACDTPAARPLACFSGTCQACGHNGQACCGGDAQHVGGQCFGGSCANQFSMLAGHCG